MAGCSYPTHTYPLSTIPSVISRLVGTRFSLQLNSRRWSSTTTVFLHKPLKASLVSASTKTTVGHSENSISTLRELCQNHVPDHVISRMEEIGYVLPTNVQQQALPILFSGRDCVLHAQTGSGKTLPYLLQIFSAIKPERSSVQALIVVPTRELGIQVTKVARMLAAEPAETDSKKQSCCVMALLDGGSLRRQKSWLKAEPPTIVVATVESLCQMLEKQSFRLETLQVLVVDEVDFMFNSSKQVGLLRKLLTSYSSSSSRQTVFASASIPQHNRFLYDCIQQKWTKDSVVHVHVNPVQPMPSCLHHRFVVCNKRERHSTLLSLLQIDAPQSAMVFVGQQVSAFHCIIALLEGQHDAVYTNGDLGSLYRLPCLTIGYNEKHCLWLTSHVGGL